MDKPLDLKTKHDEKPETQDKCNQANCVEKPKSLEIKIDANSILPEDHFDDDKLFMNSLIPLFKKMNDDTRLLCRIEVLKIIRYALQGHKCFEALNVADNSFDKDLVNGVQAKEETNVSNNTQKSPESKLAMTTRSADGSRPVRKRRVSNIMFIYAIGLFVMELARWSYACSLSGRGELWSHRTKKLREQRVHLCLRTSLYSQLRLSACTEIRARRLNSKFS